MRNLNAALQAGGLDLKLASEFPLAEFARAHKLAEHPVRRGRVVVTV